ncbi:MAG: ATP-binding cassette domain-containing protein [Phycisphaerales bacterium]|nr:ATP-binding cassette domain-containing protein [Planctomycetota bacterium]MCH8509844.1 ATP-binding cassette domain-containing protein [Phycisphaerales bacterium]
MDSAIRMRGVRKAFGSKVAVEGMDLDVPTGSLHGFIGPNGAGKSTTIRMIMSILFPDTGELSVLGRRSAVESKDRIGYLPEERGVYKKMKVASFLIHMGRLKGIDAGPALKKSVHDWLEKIGLPDVAKKKCEELSKGMQQKVQFVSCVLHEPDLIILDEPFSGLDPVNMRLLRDLIREQHDAGRTVIFSTHVMSQAEQLCDHIVMIHDGRKVLDDPVQTIRSRHKPTGVWFEPFEAISEEQSIDAVRGLPGIANVRRIDGKLEALLGEGVRPDEAVRLVASAASMASVDLHRPGLEDIFIQIVTDGQASADDRAQLRAALRDIGGDA